MFRSVLRLLKPSYELFRGVSVPSRSLHLGSSPAACVVAKVETPLFTQIRTKVRCYFPRPNEVKRVRRHGWQFRMSTPNGRRIIMRRILKGCHVLSH